LVSEVTEYVSVGKVLDTVLPLVSAKRSEVVPISDAYGRIAARDVLSAEDVPPMSASHMDGYAFDSRDTAKASKGSPVALPVVGEVGLGVRPKLPAGRNKAVKVSTGSFLPNWTDAVVPVEQVSTKGNRIVITAPIAKGEYVFRPGGDIRKGEVVIRKGEAIRAQEIGLAISLGLGKLRVFTRPRVAILATGSELVSSVSAGKAHVSNSHVPIFVRLIQEAGCEVLDLGIARDVHEEILSRVQQGLSEADLVLTTGGTSVGVRDLMGGVVAALRPRVLFHGIRMDRGRVAGVALVGRKPMVMMPGPMQGAMNAFLLFGVPIMRRLAGGPSGEVLVGAKLRTPWAARQKFPNFTKVVYARLFRTSRGAEVEIVKGETESMTVLTRSNGFLVVPENRTSLEAGEEVEVHLLPGFSFA